jgi:hypothetical protein
MWQCRPHALKHREHVRAERVLQLFRADIVNAVLGMLFGDIIYEDIQTAELLHHCCHYFPARSFSRKISRQRQCSTPCCLDRLARLTCILTLLKERDRHIRALLRECDRDGAPDSAVSTRHQRHLALKLSAPSVTFHE